MTKKYNFWLPLTLGVLLLLPAVIAFSASISFNDPAFATTWYRLDKAVQDTPASGRGFT